MGIITRAYRNISRRKMRTLLVIIALAFSMAIMISIPAGALANQEAAQNLTTNYNSLITNMQNEINSTATLIECRTTSGQAQAMPSGGQGFPSGIPSGTPSGSPSFGFGQNEVFVNETIGDEIGSIDGVAAVVPFLESSSAETTSQTISTPRGDFTVSRPAYTVAGVSLNSSLIEYSNLPTNITAGRNLREGDSGVVIISSNLTDYFGVGVGDEVTINGTSFTVLGTYEPSSTTTTGGGGAATRGTVYMSISDAQAVTDLTGQISMLDVYAENASAVDSIAETIKVAYSDLYVTTYKDRLSSLDNMQQMYTTTLDNAESTLAQTQATATQEIIIVVAATSLIVLFMMLYTVRERTKEIGTLKAIGFSNWNVMSQFMLEGTLISLLAGVVGVAIGSFAAPTLSSLLLPSINLFGGSTSGRFGFAASPTATSAVSATATIDPQLVLLALGAAVLLGALGSLYPAWRAAKIRPAEAMRYE